MMPRELRRKGIFACVSEPAMYQLYLRSDGKWVIARNIRVQYSDATNGPGPRPAHLTREVYEVWTGQIWTSLRWSALAFDTQDQAARYVDGQPPPPSPSASSWIRW